MFLGSIDAISHEKDSEIIYLLAMLGNWKLTSAEGNVIIYE
jgi:hypothetical protein